MRPPGHTIAGFHKPFRTIVMATPSDNLRVDELFERDPLAQWGSGAVTLLGDAAHPMLPHAGQGAAPGALEDAVVLGQALRSGAAPEVGLRRYERRVRGERTPWCDWRGGMLALDPCESPGLLAA